MTSENSGLPEPVENTSQAKKRSPFLNWVCAIPIFGFVFAFSPLAYGYIQSYLYCGGGGVCYADAAVWALFLTLPVGLIIMVVGVIFYLILVMRRAENKNKTIQGQDPVTPG